MKKVFFIFLLTLGMDVSVHAQSLLFIPDTISTNTINLNIHPDSVQFFPGQKTATYAFNAYSYLAPTIILHKDSAVSITVDNQIADTTTVHWHGLHVAPVNDGGPHTVILPGQSWNPSFTVMDKASTYWYHPHLHMKTAEQAMKGAAGMIIVRDGEEAAINLPRTYGVDDIPLIIQSQQFDIDNQILFRGMEDSTLLVNGQRANYGHSVYKDLPAQVVRLRILNASQERSFNFGFTNNMVFSIIGSDGGLLATPVAAQRIRLSPGERGELLLDLSGMNGQSFYLMSYASELPMGVQGGPTMPMPPWSPPMDSPLNGVDFNILQFDVVAPTSNPVTVIPSSLVTLNPWLEAQSDFTRAINFTADSAMVMDGPFYFNGNLYDMNRIDYEVPLDNIEIWELRNQTMVAHPFHIHGVQFYVLDRDGVAPPLEERGRKDVVLVQSNEVVRFITRFEDFEDMMIPYMYHCHILMHEDDGMMGQFLVSSMFFNEVEPVMSANDLIRVYPNPAADIFYMENNSGESGLLRVTDVSGKLVIEISVMTKTTEVTTCNWNRGIYFVQFISHKGIQTKKVIID